MAGIISYGAYIPYLRLPLAAIAGKEQVGGPEKAVAYYDEDALTLGAAAAQNCLEDLNRTEIDALFFASTSYPYQEKQAASILVKALGLPASVRAVDFGGSLRAGTNALAAACDAVTAQSARRILVIASDCRLAAPRSALEQHLGDAAAAFLVGPENGICALNAHHAVSDEIIDVWRSESDPYIHSWEDRFVIEHGYRRQISLAVQALLEQAGVEAGSIAHTALYAPDPRSHKTVASSLGLDTKKQLVDPLFGKVGNSGCAAALLQFASALEDAKPSEKILVASYGDGAEAFLFEAENGIHQLERRAVRYCLERKRPLLSYDHYLKYRNLDAREWQAPRSPGISATIHYRDREEDLAFMAHECQQCQTLQYPFQRVCFSCYSKDRFNPVRLAERTGTIRSFSFDYFAGSPDPPLVATMTESNGGCRIYLQMTDVNPKEVKLAMPVEFTFRKVHDIGQKPNYFWKCTPLRKGKAQ